MFKFQKNKYRELASHLRAQACTVNVYSPEYRNLNKRIALCIDKAAEYDRRIYLHEN